MNPDAVTPAWMSTIFGTEVTDVACERIGDGLVGLNLRATISSADDAVPSSVVIKLPSLDPTSRLTGITLRNYEREVKFYERVSQTVDIRVPTCHHSSWTEETGDFVLVLEDMAESEQGDQIAGCTVDRARVAVEELARLHGPRWNDPSLADHEFLQRRNGPEDVDQLRGLWEMFLPGFMSEYGEHLDPSARTIVAEFGAHVGEWLDGRSQAVATVTHGDYRLDNLLFGTSGDAPAVTAVDWQTPGHGAPVADLAYFCGAGLMPEDRRTHERSLLGTYSSALDTYGVVVDEAWLWDQYRREAFAGVVMAVIASQIVGSSDRSGAMFTAMTFNQGS